MASAEGACSPGSGAGQTVPVMGSNHIVMMLGTVNGNARIRNPAPPSHHASHSFASLELPLLHPHLCFHLPSSFGVAESLLTAIEDCSSPILLTSSMRFSTASLALGLLPLISAAPAPIQKRALSASDTSVLQLALFLEHLELNLYTGGYLNFTDAEYTAAGFPAGFRDNVGVIASVCTHSPRRASPHLASLLTTADLQHESTHQLTIASILQENGVTPVPNCTYSFPYNSPQSFVALANMITTYVSPQPTSTPLPPSTISNLPLTHTLTPPSQRRHRSLPRRRHPPNGQPHPPHLRLLNPNSRSPTRFLPALRRARLPLPHPLRHRPQRRLRLQPRQPIRRFLPATPPHHPVAETQGHDSAAAC